MSVVSWENQSTCLSITDVIIKSILEQILLSTVRTILQTLGYLSIMLECLTLFGALVEEVCGYFISFRFTTENLFDRRFVFYT